MHNDNKIKAIIIDIDGTISNDAWRKHLLTSGQATWDQINEASRFDQPNEWCLTIVKSMREKGYKLLFVTARNEKYKDDTIFWLNNIVGGEYELFMRPANDKSDDCIIKMAIYNAQIHSTYDVEFCIEDKPSVSDMWRDIGLTCLQCA